MTFAKVFRAWASALLLMGGVSNGAAAVVLNELMASNGATYADEHQEFDDWIEIHNLGSEAVDLAGWFLSDDPSQPAKWRFPTNLPAVTILSPGAFLVVWADGQPEQGPLHASFRLDADGETLLLVRPDGLTLADEVQFSAQPRDLSWGRDPDGSGGWALLQRPTPGQSNAAGFRGEVAAVRVWPPGGLYQFGTLEVTLSCATPRAAIYYTLDGSVPSPAHGTRYTNPIRLNAGAVLRVAAYRAGWRSSPVATHTYVPADAKLESLQVIALAGDPVTTFGLQGLYADVLLRGSAAEFPVSFEILPFSGRARVQLDAGIRLQGSSYRRRTIGANPSAKWSYKIYFDRAYGDGDWLEYDLIEGTTSSRFRRLTLRSGYNDSNNPFIKDELGRRLFGDMGQPTSQGTLAMLYQNGRQKNNGYYNPTERIDEPTLQEKFGSSQSWDVVSKWQPSGTPADPPRRHNYPYLFDVRDGDAEAFARLLEDVQRVDVTTAAGFETIAQQLDMANFVDYLIIQGYTRIRDWPQNNWNAARERSAGRLGRWRFYAWDLEFGWGSNELTDTFKVPTGDSLNPLVILYSRLGNSPQFRRVFTDRVQKHFFNEGALTATNVIRRFEELRQAMSAVLPNMQTYIRDTWAEQRPGYVINSLQALGLFTFEGPRCLINGERRSGGPVPWGSVLTLENPRGRGTIYFSLDGSDPTNRVWPGSLRLTQTTRLRARIRDGNVWSGLVEAVFGVHEPAQAGNLVITEIQYHPAPPTPAELALDSGWRADDFEFIELKNITSRPVDLTGVRMVKGIGFVFDADAPLTLPAGSNLVLVKNRRAFQARYGSGLPVAGEYDGELANGGERLLLLDATGAVLQDLRYEDDWQPLTDGHGFSLVRADLTLPPHLFSQPDGWRTSSALGGSPGIEEENPPSIVAVRVNEVVANPGAGEQDAIELYNPTSAPADISGWWLSDDFDALQKFRIPTGTVIAPHGYVVFTAEAFDGNSPAGFGLDADGETVYLASADAAGRLTGYLDVLTYPAVAEGVAVGRVDGAGGMTVTTLLRVPTLGQTNAEPAQSPVQISEIHYHPAPVLINGTWLENTTDEFVELVNHTASPIDLFDPAHPTNTWRLRGTIDFDFPTNVMLPPGGHLVVVAFDPEADLHLRQAFRAKYDLPEDAIVLGPFAGTMGNQSGRLRLLRPDPSGGVIGTDGTALHYVTVEELRYQAGWPWPVGADGYGYSLQRTTLVRPASDPAAWQALQPTPGRDAPVAHDPAVVAEPSDQEALAYTTVQFEVQATGSGPLRYQWRFEGTNLPGATNATLILREAKPEQAGHYQAVVMSATRAVGSRTAELRLRMGPRILDPPHDQEARPGETVTLSVSATSRTTLSYQWRKDGVPIPGATEPVLQLTDVQVSDDGLYDVVVTDEVGSIVSRAARVAVLVNPKVLHAPVSVSAVEGETVVLSIEVEGTLPIGYRWRRSGSTIRVDVLDDHQSFLVLTNVQLADAGIYTVVITNAAFYRPGVLSSGARLEILPDTDGDRLPDAWELAHQLDPGSPDDTSADQDHDGLSLLEEYRAGTDPDDAASCLRIEAVALGEQVRLSFPAVAGRTYTVQSKASLDDPVWAKVADVAARSTNEIVVVNDEASSKDRYYRVVTPRQP